MVNYEPNEGSMVVIRMLPEAGIALFVCVCVDAHRQEGSTNQLEKKYACTCHGTPLLLNKFLQSDESSMR